MLIYRVQNKSGVGVYQLNVELNYGHQSISHGRPTPNEDYILAPKWKKLCSEGPNPWSSNGRSKIKQDDTTAYWNYYFGFSSLKQLEDWLGDDECRSITYHDNTDLVIQVLEVPDKYVIVGETQAVYMKYYAKEVSQLHLVFMYELPV
jgi:hypothetical protein